MIKPHHERRSGTKIRKKGMECSPCGSKKGVDVNHKKS